MHRSTQRGHDGPKNALVILQAVWRGDGCPKPSHLGTWVTHNETRKNTANKYNHIMWGMLRLPQWTQAGYSTSSMIMCVGLARLCPMEHVHVIAMYLFCNVAHQ